MAKPKLHSSCTVIRTRKVTRGTLSLETGATTTGASEWITEPCGIPLFTQAERESGVCRSCAKGWNHPDNYRADGPRPTEESGK